jgi:hypothetical protein
MRLLLRYQKELWSCLDNRASAVVDTAVALILLVVRVLSFANSVVANDDLVPLGFALAQLFLTQSIIDLRPPSSTGLDSYSYTQSFIDSPVSPFSILGK